MPQKPDSEKTQVCGAQLTEKAVTKEVTHRCVKPFALGTTDHKDGVSHHRCYCSKVYMNTDNDSEWG